MTEYELSTFIGAVSGFCILIYFLMLLISGYNYFSDVLAVETKTYKTYLKDVETKEVYEGKQIVETKYYTR